MSGDVQADGQSAERWVKTEPRVVRSNIIDTDMLYRGIESSPSSRRGQTHNEALRESSSRFITGLSCLSLYLDNLRHVEAGLNDSLWTTSHVKYTRTVLK